MFIEVNNKLINLDNILNITVDSNESYQSYRIVFILKSGNTEEIYFNTVKDMFNYYESLKSKLDVILIK